MVESRRVDALVAEIGSTTTVVSAFDGLADWPRSQPRLLGQGVAATSVLQGDVGIGVEFYEPRVAKKLAAGYLASSIAGLLLNDHGIITAYTLNNPNVIRFEPPLIVTDEQIDRVLEAFEGVCAHYHGFLGAVAGLGRTVLTRKGL